MVVETTVLKCCRCGHEWTPRTKDVRQCPKCRSPFWDVPPKAKKQKEVKG